MIDRSLNTVKLSVPETFADGGGEPRARYGTLHVADDNYDNDDSKQSDQRRRSTVQSWQGDCRSPFRVKYS